MGLPIMNHLIPQGLLAELDVQPLFKTFIRVHLVLDMVASRLASHPLLTPSLLDLFSRCQVFRQTTLLTPEIILAIH